MDKQQLIDDLKSKLDDKKEEFLAEVHSEVASYIRRQGSGCLTLVERRSSRDVTWELAATPAYVKRLIAFCRERPYDGNQLDSALTRPVADRVAQQFESLYEDSSDGLAEAVLQFIMEDKVLSHSMADAVFASSAYAGSALRNRAASMLVDQIRHFMHTSAGHSITTFVGKSVAATVSKPIGMKMAALIIKSLSTQLKVVIAKVIASGALKGIIAAAVKKFVIFAVAGAVVKAIAAKFGISTMAAFAWVLIPVIAAYIIYEIHTFPRHLGEKVADQVVEELSERYGEVNQEACDKIISQIFDTGIAVIMRPIADSEEVQGLLKQFMEEAGLTAT